MIIEINYLAQGNADEGRVIRIYKKPGEQVQPGDDLFDIEANKGSVSIESSAAGTVASIRAEEGQMVKAGDLLAEIEDSGIPLSAAAPALGMDYFGSLLQPVNDEYHCDIAIIGGGPGGYVAAIKAAQKGAKVLLVEKNSLGGTCLNWGCIPTKALVRSAEIFKELQEAEKFGCHAEKTVLDMSKVIERKDEIVKQLVQGIKYLMEKNHIQVIEGTGEIEDINTIRVRHALNETIVHAEQMIIATGSRIAKPPFEIADSERVINSDQALAMKNLPGKMVIIGGGVIGMEFAFIYANFGVEVYVVEYCPACLTNLDSDIRAEISSIAAEKGIHLYNDAKVERIVNSEDGEVVVVFQHQGETKYIFGDKVLIAVGREPVLDGMNVEKLNIALNEKGRGIKVNSHMQTSVPNIYAIGDVTDIIQLAHVASRQGLVAVENILGNPCEMDYSVVPSAIFTDPEISVVGVDEQTAQRAGMNVAVGKSAYAASGKALTLGDARGFVKIITDKESGLIIGGAIVGAHATDLIAEITLAVQNRLTAEQLTNAIHAHPTMAEIVYEAALAATGNALHSAE